LVPLTGITGERTELPPNLVQLVRDLRAVTTRPIGVGFGISTPEQVAAVVRHADGAVVGSAIVRLVERHAVDPDLVTKVGEFIGALKAATRPPANGHGAAGEDAGAWLFGKDKPRKVTTEGLWTKCEACREIVDRADVEKNARTCPPCRQPFRLSARERLDMLLDAGSFEERDAGLRSQDPLGFKDNRGRYSDRLQASRSKTGREDALVSGVGRIDGLPILVCAFEFGFMGGSMASVVGEKITRAIEFATRKRIPLLVVTCSGGARMQDGVLSLMQMAKTSAALGGLAEERVPFFVLLADPTTGGVTASFAMLGDLILAEPRALIGFAGPRVIQETIRQPLPEGFQRAEFLLEHGMIDKVVERKDLRETLRRLLAFFAEPVEPAAP